MLDKLAESFPGCVYMYVHVLWRLLASPLPGVCCLPSPDTPPTPPPPPVNGCSHTPSPHTHNRRRTPGRGQIDWCALSLQKDLNSICLQWLQFPGQPNLPSFFFLEEFFFFFAYFSWRTVISFHYFVRIHLPSPPTIHPATEISVCLCEYVCVSLCAYVCVLRGQKSACQIVTWSFHWKFIHVYANTCHHRFNVCVLQWLPKDIHRQSGIFFFFFI